MLTMHSPGAMLCQERDLAPHERQLGERQPGGGGDRGAGAGDPSAGGSASGGGAGLGSGEEQTQGPDSLPQWKQQQRLRVEHDPA